MPTPNPRVLYVTFEAGYEHGPGFSGIDARVVVGLGATIVGGEKPKKPAVPRPPPPPDRDDDHVIDSEDRCPDSPEDLDGILDPDGCHEAE